jgi:hypothetical protein
MLGGNATTANQPNAWPRLGDWRLVIELRGGDFVRLFNLTQAVIVFKLLRHGVSISERANERTSEQRNKRTSEQQTLKRSVSTAMLVIVAKPRLRRQ